MERRRSSVSFGRCESISSRVMKWPPELRSRRASNALNGDATPRAVTLTVSSAAGAALMMTCTFSVSCAGTSSVVVIGR